MNKNETDDTVTLDCGCVVHVVDTLDGKDFGWTEIPCNEHR